MPIFDSDSGDEAIEKTINSLCQDLEDVHPTRPEFMIITEAIAKLRASQNPQIIQQFEVE